MAVPALTLGTATSATETAPDDLLNRIRGEYREMPGLRLTSAQAARLWGVAPEFAHALLAALVGAGFLFRSRDGRYGRRGDSERG